MKYLKNIDKSNDSYSLKSEASNFLTEVRCFLSIGGLIMEILLELFFDIIFEGSIAVGSEKKVPMPVRVFAGIIVLATFLGLGGLFIYMGYEAILENNMVFTIFILAVGLGLFSGGIFVIYKMFKDKNKSDK